MGTTFGVKGRWGGGAMKCHHPEGGGLFGHSLPSALRKNCFRLLSSFECTVGSSSWSAGRRDRIECFGWKARSTPLEVDRTGAIDVSMSKVQGRFSKNVFLLRLRGKKGHGRPSRLFIGELSRSSSRGNGLVEKVGTGDESLSAFGAGGNESG